MNHGILTILIRSSLFAEGYKAHLNLEFRKESTDQAIMMIKYYWRSSSGFILSSLRGSDILRTVQPINRLHPRGDLIHPA